MSNFLSNTDVCRSLFGERFRVAMATFQLVDDITAAVKSGYFNVV